MEFPSCGRKVYGSPLPTLVSCGIQMAIVHSSLTPMRLSQTGWILANTQPVSVYHCFHPIPSFHWLLYIWGGRASVSISSPAWLFWDLPPRLLHYSSLYVRSSRASSTRCVFLGVSFGCDIHFFPFGHRLLSCCTFFDSYTVACRLPSTRSFELLKVFWWICLTEVSFLWSFGHSVFAITSYCSLLWV